MKSLDRSMRRTARAGFTLVEVMLVAVIMGMMFVSVSQIMQAARKTRDAIHNFQETHLAGPAVLEMITRDLAGVFTTSRARPSWLEVFDRTVNGQDADRIDFVTTTDSLIVMNSDGDESVRADINEVGYVLRPNPDNDEFLEIYRREDFGVDEEPLRGGEYTFLSDQVKGFNIEVFTEDGPDAEPLDEWGPRAGNDELIGLPAWIRISLTVELKPRIDRESMNFSGKDRRTVTFTRVVRMPESLRVEDGQIARLGLPAAPGTGSSDPNDPTGQGDDGTGTGDGTTLTGNTQIREGDRGKSEAGEGGRR